MSSSRRKLYEGKAKIVWEPGEEDKALLGGAGVPGAALPGAAPTPAEVYIVEYKDDATALDGKKRGQIGGKGVCNNLISGLLFELLEHEDIPTHFVRGLSDREMLVKRLDIIPVEVVVRNVAAGSLAKRLGAEEGTPMATPVLELYYKSDPLGDPMVNRYHVRAMKWATDAEMDRIEALALRVNEILSRAMAGCGLRLIDFKLEFGRPLGAAGVTGEAILLGDEISPDTCRFWDLSTNEKLDKDRFRRDLGGVEEAYQEVLRRVTAEAAKWQAARAVGGGGAPGTTAGMAGAVAPAAGAGSARVFVTLKRTVLDPQGAAVENALRTLGYDEVTGVRVGKYIVLELKQATPGRVEEMCRRLLANPVIEEFRFEIDR